MLAIALKCPYTHAQKVTLEYQHCFLKKAAAMNTAALEDTGNQGMEKALAERVHFVCVPPSQP